MWASSVITSVAIVGVHITRWVLANDRNPTSEALVLLLAIAAVVLFLRDVQMCRIQTGMLKLFLLLLIANNQIASDGRHATCCRRGASRGRPQ